MGTAREKEIQVMGLALAALAVLAAFLVIWTASAINAQLRSNTPNASVTQSQGGSLGASILEHP